VTYTTLIDAWGKQGDLGKATELLRTMREDDAKPNTVTYNTLIDAWGKHGDLDKVTELLRTMREDGLKPNIVTYTTYASSFDSRGRPKDSKRSRDSNLVEARAPKMTRAEGAANAASAASMVTVQS
jgi:pentatricopeptide repeat protein